MTTPSDPKSCAAELAEAYADDNDFPAVAYEAFHAGYAAGQAEVEQVRAAGRQLVEHVLALNEQLRRDIDRMKTDFMDKTLGPKLLERSREIVDLKKELTAEKAKSARLVDALEIIIGQHMREHNGESKVYGPLIKAAQELLKK